MSSEIRILLPKAVEEILRKKAEEKKITIQELLLRAIVKIIEEETKK